MSRPGLRDLQEGRGLYAKVFLAGMELAAAAAANFHANLDPEERLELEIQTAGFDADRGSGPEGGPTV